jgi:8-oxo-dGTP pyrophosphatase MutT (NUDIX family)
MRVDMDWVRRAFASQTTGAPAAPAAGSVAAADPFAAPRDRHAVVAALLRQGPEGVEVLLIQRAEQELDPWSGHMALPGGHGDPDDSSLVATAVREISEEVGLDLLEQADLLGRLPEVEARPRQLTIFPLVFALAAGPEPTPNAHEVQRIVWARLDHLRAPEARSSYEITVRQQRHSFPAFDVDGYTVWGLTYRILVDLLQLVDPAPPSSPEPG